MALTKKTPRRNWRPLEEARVFARQLGLVSQAEWSAWSKTTARPDDIPANPAGVYKNKGWAGWGDWLGTGRIATFDRTYRAFPDAREFVHKLWIEE